MDKINEGLQYLEKKGWSDLIDRKWESSISQELRTIEGITEDEIQQILSLVLW